MSPCVIVHSRDEILPTPSRPFVPQLVISSNVLDKRIVCFIRISYACLAHSLESSKSCFQILLLLLPSLLVPRGFRYWTIYRMCQACIFMCASTCVCLYMYMNIHFSNFTITGHCTHTHTQSYRVWGCVSECN